MTPRPDRDGPSPALQREHVDPRVAERRFGRSAEEILGYGPDGLAA
jgi:hypothetical protein